MKKINTGLFCVLAINSGILATSTCAVAQVIPDTTLGAESSTTRLDPQFPIDIIEGGATRGVNLFHSFSEFNVSEGRGAYFFSPSADIQNILARVTGSNPSTILGTIGTLGNSIPNLFLINPNGIIFGANASLDIGNAGVDVGGTGGSFVATTANAVILGETGVFSASNPGASNLLSIAPSALFFNGNSPAQIVNRSIATTTVVGGATNGLQVPNSRSLILAGENVTLDSGQLFASSGTVELAGVTAGTVGLNIAGNDLSLSYPNFVQPADVFLTNNSTVFVNGSDGGRVTVNARNLDISGSTIAGGIDLGSDSIQTQARDITLDASENMAITDSNSNISFIFNGVNSGAIGKGGDIRIQSRSLSLNNAQLNTTTIGQGDAGNVFIQAENLVSMVSSVIASTGDSRAIGKGGGISIQTGSLSLNNSVLNSGTRGQGDAGNVSIQTENLVSMTGSSIFSDVNPGAIGKGGDIRIQSRSLSLNNSGLISTTTGQGDAGNVFIQAENSVFVNNNSVISSNVYPGAIGKGGNVSIQSRSLSLTDNSSLSTDTGGEGDAGSVFIQSKDTALDNSRISSSNFGNVLGIFTGTEIEVALGNGGDIQIVTGSLSLNNKSGLITNTYGLGDAGNVLISATGSVSIANDSGISSAVFGGTLLGVDGLNGEIIDIIVSAAIGNGGDLNIEAQSVSVNGNSLITTSTSGQGDAGNVSIRASGAVTFIENSSIQSGVFSNVFTGLVGADAVGQSGNLSIVADSLDIDNSTLLTSTAGRGNAGSIFVQTNNDIFLTNNSRVSSAVQQGGVGDAGDINIQGRSLYLTGGSQIRAAVERERDNLPGGQGTGGNIFINASQTVDIAGVNANGASSALSTSSDRGASGQAGNITINTGNFRIADGAVVNALTANSSNAGSITINANDFTATSGGQVLTTTSNSGSAGSINLNVANNIDFSGSDPTFAARQAQFGTDVVRNQSASSGLFANTALGSTGSGGSIFINSGEFNIADGAGVSVNSQGQGNAGNLQVQASSIRLDRGAFLSASTASGEGGNIDIEEADLLLLRRNSNITTAAGGTGNGGNIDIDSTFIVAPVSEDSNIIADAIAGNGGNIDITTQGIFGIASRPAQTNLSDITASSQLGIDGAIAITNPDVDPSQGLVALPVEVVDASNQIASGCTNSRQATNKFTVTGRGGLPPNPDNPLTNDSVLTDWATVELIDNNAPPITKANQQPPRAIVEAQGWIVDAQGRVVLTAQAPQVTPNSSPSTTTTCNGS